MSNLIHITNVELLTKEQVSINEYGVDITGADQGELLKFEVWLDASDLETYEGIPTEVRGYQFDFGFTNTNTVDPAGFMGLGMVGFNPSNASNMLITINQLSAKVAYANAEAVVDYDIGNDGPPTFVGIDKLVGTFYVSPIGDNVVIKLKDMLVVTDIDNAYPIEDIYNWVRPDTRVYVKDSSLPDGISGSYFEAVSDTSTNNTGNFYLLKLSTGQIFNSSESGSATAQYYNCGYTCGYIASAVWSIGAEVTEFDRPVSLYAPESTVAAPVYLLL